MSTNNSNAPVNMKKTVKKGKKGRKAPNKGREQTVKLLERIQNQDEEDQPFLRYAVINKNQGNGRFEVTCVDGATLQAITRDEHGKKSHKIGVRNMTVGDIVMIKLDEFSNPNINKKKVGYVVERYTLENVSRLRRFGDIPANFGVTGVGTKAGDAVENEDASGITFSVNIKKKDTKRKGDSMDIYAMLDKELGSYESDEYESESDEKLKSPSSKETENTSENAITMPKTPTLTPIPITSVPIPPPIQKPGGMGMMKKTGKGGKKLNMDRLMSMKTNPGNGGLYDEVSSVTSTAFTDKTLTPDNDIDVEDDEDEFRRQLLEEQEELAKQQEEIKERQKKKKTFNKAHALGSAKVANKKTSDVVVATNNSRKTMAKKPDTSIVSGDGDVVDIDDI